MITSGNVCGRIAESRREEHILQRWTWHKFRGVQQKQLVVATVYRPVYSNGPISTYQQHKAVLLDMDVDECPRVNMMHRLGDQIQKWQEEGCQVIVCGDFNEDVSKENIRQFYDQFQMRKLILHQHGTEAPCTMIKGIRPIDGIFRLNTITPLRSGYQSFEWGLASDHRLLWIDIDMHNVLGTTTAKLWKPAARRLKCSNPILIQKFNKLRTRTDTS